MTKGSLAVENADAPHVVREARAVGVKRLHFVVLHESGNLVDLAVALNVLEELVDAAGSSADDDLTIRVNPHVELALVLDVVGVVNHELGHVGSFSTEKAPAWSGRCAIVDEAGSN